MSCSACAYCCAARTGIGMGSPAGTPTAAAAGAADAAALPGALLWPGAATGAAPCEGRTGAWWHAASSANAAKLTNRFDQLFTDFHLAVAAWVELRERSKALLHPFIIGAVLGPRGVYFMQFYGLLLERESLLLEQHVVLLQFVLVEIFWPLRTNQILAELAVQFRALEGRRRGDFGDLVIGSRLVRLERSLHCLALLGEGFFERRHQFDASEFVANRGCERQGRLGREGPAAVGARRARGAIGGDDLPQPIIAAAVVTRLCRHGAQFAACIHGRIQGLREMLHEGLEHGARLRRIAGLVVKTRRLHGRFALHLNRLLRRR